MPYLDQAKTLFAYVAGFLSLKQDDVILSSYPRSGSTWLRFILCNIVSIQECEGKLVDFEVLNSTMVELGVSNLLRPWRYKTLPRIVKTHRPYSHWMKGPKAIGLIRDPRDVMVSFYHYRKYRKRYQHESFTSFLHDREYGLEAWLLHYSSWHPHWDLTIAYEDLKSNTYQEIERILNYLAVDVAQDVIEEAIERSAISRVRAIDGASVLDSRTQFARSGQVRQWETLFTHDAMNYYKTLSRKYNMTSYQD